MTILITNDDGIDAPGIRALADLAREQHGEENVWVIAPAEENSQVGHRVTTAGPIRVEKRSEREFAVHGTPADCTRLAVAKLLPGRPDLVLSGINFGGNLGRHDFVISGTVAAAREAVFHGVPSISISNFHRAGVDFSWEKSVRMTSDALGFIEAHCEATGPGEFWNINLPHPDPESGHTPEIFLTHQEIDPLELAFETDDDGESYRYAGRYHERPASPGSDVAVCFGGDIAVSRVAI